MGSSYAKWSLPFQQVPDLPGNLAPLETYLRNQETLVQGLQKNLAALTQQFQQVSNSLQAQIQLLASKFVKLNQWLVRLDWNCAICRKTFKKLGLYFLGQNLDILGHSVNYWGQKKIIAWIPWNKYFVWLVTN